MSPAEGSALLVELRGRRDAAARELAAGGLVELLGECLELLAGLDAIAATGSRMPRLLPWWCGEPVRRRRLERGLVRMSDAAGRAESAAVRLSGLAAELAEASASVSALGLVERCEALAAKAAADAEPEPRLPYADD